MTIWPRHRAAIAGFALILATNAVALLGVAYNRAEPAESMLTLTQRELQRPYSWAGNRENSGLALQLRWRFASGDDYSNRFSEFGGGTPRWLDAAKLAELGVRAPAADAGRAERYFHNPLGRDVLVVLEMDGPAYQEAVAWAREQDAAAQAKLAADPADKARAVQAKLAHDRVGREETQNSRLFAVDAGLDRAALRARYPDSRRYAIVRARLQPTFMGAGGKLRVGGYLGALAVSEILVPLELRPAIESRTGLRPGATTDEPGFEAAVAWGRRLEPWLVAARQTPAKAP